MISITTYKLKPFLTKDEVRELMSVFAKEGPGPGTTAHYVAADGSGGLVITDSEDLQAGYRNILNYTRWIEYDMTPVLDVEQAVPYIMDSLS